MDRIKDENQTSNYGLGMLLGVQSLSHTQQITPLVRSGFISNGG